MDEPGPAEVLDMEGRPPVRWRRLVTGRLAAAMALSLVVAGVLVVVDRGLRDREQRDLTACTATARRAVDEALTPLHTLALYVRPAPGGGSSAPLGPAVQEAIGQAADRAGRRLAPARRSCADVDVVWLHRSLRAQRDACVEGLDAEVAFLQSISRGGPAARRAWSSSLADC